MDIDETPSSDTVATQDADSAIDSSAASAPAETGAGTVTSETPSAAGDTLAEPIKTPGDPALGAPASRTPQQQTPNTAPAQPVDPRLKAALDEKATWGRERATMQRQLETIQQQHTRLAEAERVRSAEAERRNLRRWDPSHPEHGKFRGLLDKAELLRQQARTIQSRGDLSSEQKDALANDLVSQSLRPEEQEELRAHQEMNREFLMNPAASARQVAREETITLVQDAFKQFQEHTQAEAEVRRTMADPDKIRPHADFIREKLSSGVPYKTTMEMVEMRTRLAELEAIAGKAAVQQSDVQRQAAANAERARLAKGQASITRDPRASGTVDIYGMAKKIAAERGITTDNPKFARILSQIETDHAPAG